VSDPARRISGEGAQRCRHTLDSPRARQNSSSTPPSPAERIDDRDPCLAELLFHLDGEQTWAGAVLPSALAENSPQEVRSPESRRACFQVCAVPATAGVDAGRPPPSDRSTLLGARGSFEQGAAWVTTQPKTTDEHPASRPRVLFLGGVVEGEPTLHRVELRLGVLAARVAEMPMF
jgi:hypothetical protein